MKILDDKTIGTFVTMVSQATKHPKLRDDKINFSFSQILARTEELQKI